MKIITSNSMHTRKIFFAEKIIFAIPLPQYSLSVQKAQEAIGKGIDSPLSYFSDSVSR